MYLRGLGACTPARSISNVTPDECHAAGGIYSAGQPFGVHPGVGVALDFKYTPTPICTLPPVCEQHPGNNANISVSVPTNVTTSPQISPNLIQQQQPQNSPINASTTANTGNSQEAPSATDQYAQLQAELEAQREQQQLLFDAMKAQQAAAAQATQAMTQQPQTVYVPSPAPLDVPPVTAGEPIVQTPTNNSMLYLAGASVVIGVLALMKKGK